MKILQGAAITLVFLAYPFLVYLGIERGFVWLAPAIFSAVFLYQGYRAKTAGTRIRKGLLGILLLVGAVYLQTFTAKVMPVLIQLLLLVFFGRTLWQGPPLIESFVRLQFSDIPKELLDYCQQLTWLWTGFFAFNAVVCTALAVWGSDRWWALYNGLIIYLLIGLLTAGEYVYRHFRFPGLDIPDPKSTIKSMFVNGRKVWQDVQAR